MPLTFFAPYNFENEKETLFEEKKGKYVNYRQTKVNNFYENTCRRRRRRF